MTRWLALALGLSACGGVDMGTDAGTSVDFATVPDLSPSCTAIQGPANPIQTCTWGLSCDGNTDQPRYTMICTVVSGSTYNCICSANSIITNASASVMNACDPTKIGAAACQQAAAVCQFGASFVCAD